MTSGRSSAPCARASGRTSFWRAVSPMVFRCSRDVLLLAAVQPPTCASASRASGRSRSPASWTSCLLLLDGHLRRLHHTAAVRNGDPIYRRLEDRQVAVELPARHLHAVLV